MEPTPCPPVRDLEHLLLGRLPTPDNDRLADHLESCPRCAATLRGLDVPDTLDENPAVTFLAPAELPDEMGRLGGYRVLKVLGSGGMGLVFEAEDVALRRRVALKVMHPTLAMEPRAHRRFLREGQSSASLEHPHVVPILQVGEDRGVPFLVMPLLQGTTLDVVLKQGGGLDVSEVRRIGREAAEGLAAAHERGLIHRDVKPSNLWLESDHGGRVKVLDFGLACPAGEADSARLTRWDTVLGTPAYVAPEQAQGEPVDGRADLYSLGVVLYELCAGRPPFHGETVMSVLLAVVTEPPRPLREVNPSVPEALANLVMRMLAKHSNDRPASAREVAEALAAMSNATGSPVAEPRRVEVPAGGAWRRLKPVVTGLVMGLLSIAACWLGVELGRVPDAQIQTSGPPAEPPGVAPPAVARHGAAVGCVAFSPDGKLVASGGADGRVCLWDARTLREVAALRGHGTAVEHVAFTPDGRTLVSGGGDGTVMVWDLDDRDGGGVKVSGKLRGAFAVSPDGKTLATAAEGGVIFWDLGGGPLRRRTVLKAESNRDRVYSLAFSPNGGTLAVGTIVGRLGSGVRLWSLEGGDPVEGAFLTTDCTPDSLAFSPDGTRLAAGGWHKDGGRVWGVSGTEPREVMTLPTGGVAFSPDGGTLAVGGSLLNLMRPDQKPSVVVDQGFAVAAFSPGGRSLVTGNEAGEVRLWVPAGE